MLHISCMWQTMNIVVDAILITGPQGNNTLKAICHATGCDELYRMLLWYLVGGWCFLPTTLEEGTRLFEMEVLLSVRQRCKILKPTITNKVRCTFIWLTTLIFVFQSDLKLLESGNYDPTDPFAFGSRFAMELDEATTCSVKR